MLLHSFLLLFFPVTQRENASLKEQINLLNKELEITKEKLHTIEQAWEQTTKLGRYNSIKDMKNSMSTFYINK